MTAPAGTPVETGTPPPPEPPPPPAEAPAAPRQASPGPGTPTPAGLPSRDELTMVWGDELLDEVPRKVRARFSGGRFRDVDDGVAVFALPNEPSLARAVEVQGEVEEILQRRFGRPVPLRLVVEGSDRDGSDGGGDPERRGPAPADEEDEVDVGELEDAPGGVASGVDALTEAFPGAEVTDADTD